MTQDQENGVKVSYTLKELLTEISRDIKDLRSELGNKADQKAVEVLAGQVTDHASRLTTIEAQKKQTNRLESLWFPIISSLIIGLILGAVTVYVALNK